jgi:hypothetical protein
MKSKLPAVRRVLNTDNLNEDLPHCWLTPGSGRKNCNKKPVPASGQSLKTEDISLLHRLCLPSLRSGYVSFSIDLLFFVSIVFKHLAVLSPPDGNCDELSYGFLYKTPRIAWSWQCTRARLLWFQRSRTAPPSCWMPAPPSCWMPAPPSCWMQFDLPSRAKHPHGAVDMLPYHHMETWKIREVFGLIFLPTLSSWFRRGIRSIPPL